MAPRLKKFLPLCAAIAGLISNPGLVSAQSLAHFGHDGSIALFGNGSAYLVSPPKILSLGNYENVKYDAAGDYAIVQFNGPRYGSLRGSYSNADETYILNTKSGSLFKLPTEVGDPMAGFTVTEDVNWVGKTSSFVCKVSSVTIDQNSQDQDLSKAIAFADISWRLSDAAEPQKSTEFQNVKFQIRADDPEASTKVAKLDSWKAYVSPISPVLYFGNDSGTYEVDLAGHKTLLKNSPSAGYMEFTEQGVPFFTTRRNGVPYYLILSPKGEFLESAIKPAVYAEKPKPGELILGNGTSVSAFQTVTSRSSSAWLDNTAGKIANQIAVTTNGAAVLDPSLTALVYTSDGITFFRSIRLVSGQELKVLIQQERARALSQAKVVGIGLLMSSSDNHDQFPENISEIKPYLPNGSLLDGFNYLHEGGTDLQKVNSPSEQVLGTVQTIGGTATVYYDGHAKILPN